MGGQTEPKANSIGLVCEKEGQFSEGHISVYLQRRYLTSKRKMSSAAARIFALTALVVPSASFQLSRAAAAMQYDASRSASLHSPMLATTAAAVPFASVRMAEDAVAAPVTAWIEFIQGVTEPVVPDVSLTRSRDGTTGVATFTFDTPSFLAAETQSQGETTGMYLNDEEGVLKTSEVTATFTNGRPRFVKAVVVMKGTDEWDRFMRFMERYAQSNGLGFSKA